jgi:hypothetical protein
VKQPDHDYHETTRDRDDRLIDPTCAYCGKPKHLCDGGAKQTDNLETPGKFKRSELDALLSRVEQGARDVERAKIVAWLERPCGTWGHEAGWCPTCSFKADLAEAIENGAHLLKGENSHD